MAVFFCAATSQPVLLTTCHHFISAREVEGRDCLPRRLVWIFSNFIYFVFHYHSIAPVCPHKRGLTVSLCVASHSNRH